MQGTLKVGFPRRYAARRRAAPVALDFHQSCELRGVNDRKKADS